MTGADLIDVIIPVYKGLRQTRRCIESVQRNPQSAPFEIVVIDDASPDPEIGSYLKRLAALERITLISNARNLGFVRVVNLGMSLHPDRDVVLLNSDTEVANDWLDRLRRCAYAQPDVGTVTPFSNNATICSYPFEGWAGGIPGTLGLAALDRLFATTNAGRTLDLPTAVGFCVYIRRACLEQIGFFDAELFGRGYGEENDFCMRAASKGWRSVLAGDVLVFHEGAVSFSDERDALMKAAESKLLEAHPDYPHKVREFIARDPLGALRDAADRARLEHGTVEARHVLAERCDECARLRARLGEFDALSRGLAHAEALVAERDAAILELNQEIAGLSRGLAHAEALVAERDAAILELNQEIARLRAELSDAESLASSRTEELERIRRS